MDAGMVAEMESNCDETAERSRPQTHEPDWDREQGMAHGSLSLVVNDGSMRTSARRSTAPSQTGDGHAKRIANKKHREDGSGRWANIRTGSGS